MSQHRRPGTAAYSPYVHNNPPMQADNDDTVSYVSRKSGGASSIKSSLKSGIKSIKNRRQLTILGKDGKAINTPSN